MIARQSPATMAIASLLDLKASLPPPPPPPLPAVVINNATNLRLGAALTFANQGMPVLPLWWPVFEEGQPVRCACGAAAGKCTIGKHPHGRLAPHGIKSATLDERTVVDWFEQAPDANYGVVCGEHLLALDVDPRHSGDVSLAALISEHGPLPDTTTISTGSGGKHFYFNPQGKRFSSSAGMLARGIDVKAAGGYVVGPYSWHGSGRLYEVDSTPGLAPLPPWLEKRLQQTSHNGVAKSAAEWSRIAREGLVEGSRNVTITKVAGHVFRRNVAVDIAVAMLLAWNRQYGLPPLDDDEVLKIIGSIAGREAARRRSGHGRREQRH